MNDFTTNMGLAIQLEIELFEHEHCPLLWLPTKIE